MLLIGIHLDITRVHTESTQSTITAHIVLVLKHPLLVENAHSFHPREREKREVGVRRRGEGGEET